MGRPVNKRYFGNPNPDGTQLRVEADTGNGDSQLAYILAQKGTNQFRVTDGTTALECRLVDKASGVLAVGEMVINGLTSDTSTRVTIKKLFNRTATDFAGNRYTWEIQDDSTQSQLILTSF
jgi:hypothetical protein